MARELRYLLTVAGDAGKRGCLTQTGVAYSAGVALIEDFNVARGKGTGAVGKDAGNLPRFVDVRLSAEDKVDFSTWERRGGDLVTFMQSMADDGYRIGVAWSGETQAYTVSLTCRDKDSHNAGLCMTSFATTLSTALWLALYKHLVKTNECWLDGASVAGEEFG